MFKQGINVVHLIGYLGANPEHFAKDPKKAVTKFNLATSETFESQGNKTVHTQWHPITVFNGLANYASRHIQKGDMVAVIGKLKTSQWQDENGQTRYKTEIIAGELQLLRRAAETADKDTAEANNASVETAA